jgi:hypothetical protein
VASDDRICPLRNDVCLGRRCALAQKVDSANVSAYRIYWTCGLVTTHDSFNHGRNHFVDSEERKSRW